MKKYCMGSKKWKTTLNDIFLDDFIATYTNLKCKSIPPHSIVE